MNYLWGAMIILSLVYSFMNGNVSETVAAGLDGAAGAVEVVLSFAGVMCLWNGLLKACEESGITGFIKKLLAPVIGFLFPGLSKKSKAVDYITMNICANLLGTGNGATPVGIKAMKELDNANTKIPTDEMCMFIVLNTTAFQLIPSTIIALRTAAGSENIFSILVPIWITSAVAQIVAVLCVKIMCLLDRKRGI